MPAPPTNQTQSQLRRRHEMRQHMLSTGRLHTHIETKDFERLLEGDHARRNPFVFEEVGADVEGHFSDSVRYVDVYRVDADAVGIGVGDLCDEDLRWLFGVRPQSQLVVVQANASPSQPASDILVSESNCAEARWPDLSILADVLLNGSGCCTACVGDLEGLRVAVPR